MKLALELARASGALKFIPKHVKLWTKAHLDFSAIQRADWQERYQEILSQVTPAPLATQQRVTIVHDWMLRHAHYEAACRELGVPYSILDITRADWLEQARQDQGQIYFVRPFVLSSTGRSLYEERSWLLAETLKKRLFPSYLELWSYESKRRVANLLALHGIPHAPTWAFFDREAALQFLDRAPYPLVFKTDLGSDAAGVRILKNARQARRMVQQCFGKGFSTLSYGPHERNRDQVLFQLHLGKVLEWRVIRVHNSYAAYQKMLSGDFHSGSKKVNFAAPPLRLLEFARQTLEKLGMESVALDIFEDDAGQYLVNEVQAYYGANEASGSYCLDGQPLEFTWQSNIEMLVNGKPGRYYHQAGQWQFEEGDFFRNAGCNLRVKLAFQQLGTPLPGYLA